MTRLLFSLLALLAAALLFGCFGQGKSYGDAKLLLPDGTQVNAEVPLTTPGMAMGLMHRDGLCEDCGMLFVFGDDGRHGIWMKNMRFDIDVVFLDSDWRVVGVAQDVPPCAKEPCTVYTPDSDARYVLELDANASIVHGITVGSGIKLLEGWE